MTSTSSARTGVRERAGVARVRTLATAAPLVVAAIGLWLSCGAVAPPDAHAPRLGVVPSPWFLVGLLAVAALVLAAMVRRRLPASALRPLYLAGLLWLPWLPVPVPAACYLWQGPLTWLVWTVVAVAMASPALAVALGAIGRRTPEAQRALAFVIALALYGGAAWRMAPVLPGGDEPHYLIIAQSLLSDRDLRIENNHQRRDYASYLDVDIKPHYLRRGVDREIYSIHAPGLAALVAPAFAVAGYPGVVVFLSIVSALGMALLWWTVWRMTGSAAASWVAWAGAALTAPFFFQSFAVFPDGPGAVLVIVGVSALAVPERLKQVRWCTACGLAIAMLPWLHTRYAAIAGVLLVLLLGRMYVGQPFRAAAQAAAQVGQPFRAAALAVPPLVSAAAWLWSFHVIYGTANPAAPYGGYTQSGLEKIPNGLTGLLVDQQFGILPYAPACILAFAGFWWLARRSPRLVAEIALVVLPYAALVASYHMWWGGRSSPARFLVPVLPLLSFGLAALWHQGRRRTWRVVVVALVMYGAGMSLALAWVDRGALVYNSRDGYALWADAAVPVVHLPMALPSLFRGSWPLALAFAGCWGLALLLGWMLIAASDRRLSRTEDQVTAWSAAAAVAMMTGTTLGWTLAGTAGADASAGRLRLLAAITPRSQALELGPAPRLLRPDTALESLQIPSSTRRPATDALFTVERVPPGRYGIRVHSAAFVSGQLEARAGRDTRPFVRVRLASERPGLAGTIRLPAGARLLTIAGDDAARASVQGLTLEVQRIGGTLEADAHTAGLLAASAPALARSIARYGGVVAHFVDGFAFVEPTGFWVRAAREATVVFAVDPGGEVLPLVVRNGPVPNQARLVAGAWRLELDLSPGEQRVVDVPNPHGKEELRVSIRSGGGFRPADHDPQSRDLRLLGVWITP